MRRQRRRRAMILGLLAFVTWPDTATAQQPLARLRPELEARVARHRGVVGIALIELASGESLTVNDGPFPSASVIKLPILIEVFHQVEQGRLRLDDPLTLLAIDQVPGAGILRHLSTPHQLTVRDAATLMIVLSDNSATNLLIDKLGIRAINARMDSLGFGATRLHAKVFRSSTTSIDPAASERYGLGVTTPLELARMFEQLYRGTLISERASAQMLDILKLQFSGDRIPRYLPDVEIAHKTGEVNAARHDCGVVYATEAPFVLCILTRENEDQSWRLDNDAYLLAAELARTVHEALSAPRR